MITPQPIHGLVIRHAFLWSHEKQAGREEGSKDRPAVIIMVVDGAREGELRVAVVPITHTPPAEADGGIEVPEGLMRTARWLDLRPAHPAEAANAARRVCGEPRPRMRPPGA